jgi:hypothetical protein
MVSWSLPHLLWGLQWKILWGQLQGGKGDWHKSVILNLEKRDFREARKVGGGSHIPPPTVSSPLKTSFAGEQKSFWVKFCQLDGVSLILSDTSEGNVRMDTCLVSEEKAKLRNAQ